MMTTFAALAGEARAETFTVIHDFAGPEGANPGAALVLDGKGGVLGTAYTGGFAFTGSAPGQPPVATGAGVAFHIDAAGTYAPLVRFDGTYGKLPRGRLHVGRGGYIYGLTSSGGPNNMGTLFRIAPNATHDVVVMHTFWGIDGMTPFGGLIEDGAGDLFASTFYGGTGFGPAGSPPGNGEVVRMNENGDYAVLHRFGGADGSGPFGDLLLHNGWLWGTTVYGTASTGVVFKMRPTWTSPNPGPDFRVVRALSGADGINGMGGLAADHHNNIFGLAANGGAHNAGTIFKIDAGGNFSVVHAFQGGKDGAFPVGTLHLVGNVFYGVTKGNSTFGQPGPGLGGNGTVFRFDPATGAVTTVHYFSGGTDGANPFAGVVADAHGTLYGTAQYGGTHKFGVVYKLVP